MLVGDVIIRGRELAPDMPSALDVPTTAVITAVGNIGASSTLPVGSYYVKVTGLTPWGETTASAEFGPVVIADFGHAIHLTFVTPSLPCYGYRVYYGIGSGGENQFQDIVADDPAL